MCIYLTHLISLIIPNLIIYSFRYINHLATIEAIKVSVEMHALDLIGTLSPLYWKMIKELIAARIGA
jgi:hypothetical protein